jgi:hypothetical protein
MIMDFNQLDLTKSYTYADCLTWQFAEMVQVVSIFFICCLFAELIDLPPQVVEYVFPRYF